MKFIKLLDLNKKTQNKLSDFEAFYYDSKNSKNVAISFTINSNLFPKDVAHLIKRIEETNKHESFNNININVYETKVNQLLGFLRAEEIYEYIFELIKSNFNKFLDMSDIYVELNKIYTTIVVTKKETYNFMLEIEDKLNLILTNFGIISKPLELFFSEINRKEWVEKKLKSREKAYESKVYSPQLRPGYKKLDPTHDGELENIYFEGEVVSLEVRSNIKTKKGLMSIFTYTIGKGSFDAVVFIQWMGSNSDEKPLKKGSFVRVYGNWIFDRYRNSFKLDLGDSGSIQLLNKNDIYVSEIDPYPIKRSELNAHTRMSTMDGVGPAGKLIDKAREFGFKAIAITDLDSVQAFPEATQHMENNNIKDIELVYGAEITVVNDLDNIIVFNSKPGSILNTEYIFFDLETTGISPLLDVPIEFGAVKYKNGNITETKQIFINPGFPIPKSITDLTGITDEMLKGQPSIKEALIEIKKWIGDHVLVAHNAKFDLMFLDSFFKRYGLGAVENTVIDTLGMARLLYPNLWNHQLGTVAKKESIPYSDSVAHRADYDAQILQRTYENMIHHLVSRDIRDINELNNYSKDILDFKFPNIVTVLVKNQKGMKDLFKLISHLHVDGFNKKKKRPQILFSELIKRRENLLLGSTHVDGILFEEASYNSTKLDYFIKFFDYIEITPPSVNNNLILKNLYSKKGLNLLLNTVIESADKFNIPVIATSDCKYANKEDKISRDVYIANPGLGGKRHKLFNFKNSKQSNPDQHLRTTQEMFDELKQIVGEQKAEQLIVHNPNNIVDLIDKNITPLKKKLYTPSIPGAEEKFLETIKSNITKKYGHNPDELIVERIEKEINSIISHGFSIVYYLSSLAVEKSTKDGYLVGSRGSVGSSFAATMSGITEVNPLPAHYLCKKCKYHEFVKKYSSGFDLPNKKCPNCDTPLDGDGHTIPFETFLGFDGDKVPDIDLNFSRENQSHIHQYIKELLGEKNVFRAGTISTVANRTAFGYVKNYLENKDSEINFSNTMINYLATKVEGTKRTTGQHPGGLIVVPNDMDIHDFSPVNFPGNDSNSDWKTTHFDFHTIHDNLLKLDLLGHLDPSTLRMLQNITEVDPTTIKMNDKEVISLFESNKALNFKNNYVEEDLGIIGIPEFGTSFVRKLVEEAKPKSFADLIRLSGLSHGTDVWTGNAKDLILKENKTLKEVISTRDDIMIYLIEKGIDNLTSFKIMESVRKGKGLNPEWEKLMKDKGVPEWYIDSCKKIKYMFPKAHATAYVIMAFRIAWYKINYPLEYYATYFTKRDAEFDVFTIAKGPSEIKKYRNDIIKKGWNASSREKEILDTYEVVLELLSRGFEISQISIRYSQSSEWVIKDGKLIPPFSILDGMGSSAADSLIKERTKKHFSSLEDFKKRSGINKTQIAILEEIGLLNNLKKEMNQDGTGQITLNI